MSFGNVFRVLLVITIYFRNKSCYSALVLHQIILTFRHLYPNRCFYCGVQMKHGLNQSLPTKNIDHVIPRKRGGNNRASNRVPCCKPCNMSKRSLPLDEFREKFGKPFYYETISDELVKAATDIETRAPQPKNEADPDILGNAIFRKILVFAAQGETNLEIAMRLGTSEQTIKNYWVRIRERLGAINAPHAIYLAYKNGVLEVKDGRLQ
jgi:DNA-binding CsgD family transcriptional regulator